MALICYLYETLNVLERRRIVRRIIAVMINVRLRWLEHLFRMQEQNLCRKLTLYKPRVINE
jgi:hypothetical protein